MKSLNDIKKLIKQTKTEPTPEMRKTVLDDALEMQQNRTNDNIAGSNTWRIIMNSNLKFAAVAVVFIGVILGIQIFSINSAAQAFARAIDTVKQAKTLSCIERFGSKSITEQQWIFKAPDLMRFTLVAADIDDEFLGETTIVNYSKRKQLIVQPKRNKAELVDMSSEYEVNSKTGKVELSKFDMSLRDRLLSLTAKAVEDLGTETLKGKEVRKLQSKDDKKVATVWVGSKSGLPVQIEIKYKKQLIKYSDIKIDQPVDDSMFSLVPPEGYEYTEHISRWPDEKRKVCARLMFLVLKCWEFAGKNKNQFPQTLNELELTGLSKQALQNVLTANNSSIEYVKPDLKADRSTQIVMYESYEQWPKDGIVAGFADGHAELIATEQTFNKIVKKNTE